jgi:hypothetical protein
MLSVGMFQIMVYSPALFPQDALVFLLLCGIYGVVTGNYIAL